VERVWSSFPHRSTRRRLARARSGDVDGIRQIPNDVVAADTGLAQMRDGIATCCEEGLGNYIPFFTTALAEAEAEAGELETALATIDAVIAETELRGQHSFESESHRVRGEILRKRDAANPAPAEEAFRTAIAVARQQKARSFELRAALSLAKLYQSSGRPPMPTPF
jgi:predicted ATPase